MRVLLLGGSGFVGRHAFEELQDRGHEPLVASRSRPPWLAPASWTQCDVPAGVPEGLAAHADVVVNLVGIKAESGANSFERAHVEASRAAVKAAALSRGKRLIHISVCMPEGAWRTPYLRTKEQAEAVIVAADVGATILRPSLICGAGDDAIAELTIGVRRSGWFPLPGGGQAMMEPVAVRDVARVIAEAACGPARPGVFSVVGPESLKLADLVRRVAGAVEPPLPVRVVPVPTAVMRAALALGSRLGLPLPLTPSQLGMLAVGLRRDGSEPWPLGDATPLDRATLQVAQRDVPSPLSLRIQPHPDTTPLAPIWTGRRHLALTSAVIVAVLLVATTLIPNPLRALPLAYAGLLAALAIIGGAAPRRPRVGDLAWGLGVAALGHAIALGVATAADRIPWLHRGLDASMQVLAFAPWAGPPLVTVLAVAAAEEWVFRRHLLPPLARHFGPLAGLTLAALAFGLAHAAFAPPLLLIAAVGFALLWGAVTLRTGAPWAALIAHLAWDAYVVLAHPFAASSSSP